MNTTTPTTSSTTDSTFTQFDGDAATPATGEAKSRFNAALEEAKAGASALKSETAVRAQEYTAQAKDQAAVYADKAKVKAGDLAVEGKAKASEALAALSRMVSDNAAKIDESFGAQYGDYARSAAQSLQASADKIDQKSLEELGEDARTFVREKPGASVGIAVVAGLVLARLFGGRR